MRGMDLRAGSAKRRSWLETAVAASTHRVLDGGDLANSTNYRA